MYDYLEQINYTTIEITDVLREYNYNIGRYNMEYSVTFTWDNETSVWIATSKDIPGLVLESGSFDALMERVRFAIPELLELNQLDNMPLSLVFTSERHERMVL